MKSKHVLLINGVGGHRYEMQRLLHHIKSELAANGYSAIHLGDDIVDDLILESYAVGDIRHKNSHIRTIFMALSSLIYCLITSFRIGLKYNISAVLTTGPGLCILPSLIMKFFFGSKIIFFETSCMFYNKSLTGIFMKRIADVFVVQNAELLKVYPSSIFLGRL